MVTRRPDGFRSSQVRGIVAVFGWVSAPIIVSFSWPPDMSGPGSASPSWKTFLLVLLFVVLTVVGCALSYESLGPGRSVATTPGPRRM
jgi:hypothetical protein